MLYEVQKVSAALLLVNELVEGPKVKGKPRIVRATSARTPTLCCEAPGRASSPREAPTAPANGQGWHS